MSSAPSAGVAFAAALAEAFEAAVRRVGVREERLRVAGASILLRFAGNAARSRLIPAFASRLETVATRAAAAPAPADATIDVFDTDSTGVAPPPPPGDVSDVRERGEFRGVDDEATRVAYNIGSGILNVFDRASCRGVWWTRDARLVPYYETASPLRTLLTWVLEERGVRVVHAACVAEAGVGVLLTAKGGSGKSTTALLCRTAGLGYLGDNNVAVSVAPVPTAHALFDSASLRRDNRVRVEGFAARVVNPDRSDEKALAFVVEGAAPGPASCRLRAILLPRVAGASRPTLRPVSAAEALRALAPSSLFVQPGAGPDAFAAAARLVRSLPAYVLDLADDPAAVIAAVRSALTGAVGTSR